MPIPPRDAVSKCSVTSRAALTVLLALVAGCSPLQLRQRPFTPADPPPLTARPPYVGLAVSGGGNRAAIYAGYVMDLLSALPVRPRDRGAADSFMDTVQYLSSVSGGGFAASYYAVHKQGYALSGAAWSDQKTRFFEAFHAKMQQDWESAMLGRWVTHPFTSAPAELLDAKLNQDFLRGVTFGDLEAMEKAGKAPVLIFNATHYDTGRRFVMTNLPTRQFSLSVDQLVAQRAHLKQQAATHPEAFQTFAFQQAQANLRATVQQTYEAAYAVTSTAPSDTLLPDGFDALSGPGSPAVEYKSMPLSRAVAASGAFPGLGPLSFAFKGVDGRTVPDYTYTHFIDGGVTDNSGVESLAQLFLRELDGRKDAYALMVMIDAQAPFRDDGQSFRDKTDPLAILLAEPARLSDEQGVRANFFRKALWTLAGGSEEMVKGSPDDVISRTKVVEIRHVDLFAEEGRSPLDALLAPDPLPFPQPLRLAACPDSYDREQARQYVARISTRYRLNRCNDAMLRVAACSTVLQQAPAIAQFFSLAEGAPVSDTAAFDAVKRRAQTLCPELFSG